MSKKSKHGKNPESMQKQIGCVYGFFQLFDPHHLLPGRRVSNRNHKTLTPGTSRSESNTNSASSSSSSRSSRLSSLEFGKAIQSDTQCSNVHEIVKDSICRKPLVLSIGRDEDQHFVHHPKKYIDSPRPSCHKRSVSNGDGPADMARHSYDGMDIQFRSTMKLKEVPRLSLDSKVRMMKSSSKEEEDHQQTPRTLSVIARLMGMETVPQEPVPPSSPLSVYGEIEKRLSTLDFKRSGKDLRALKHILEAMQKKKKKESMDITPEETSDSPMITMKTARVTTEVTKLKQTVKMTGGKNTSPARKTGAQSRKSQKEQVPIKEKVSWKKSVKSSNLHQVSNQIRKTKKSYSHGDDNISKKVSKLKILPSLKKNDERINTDGRSTNKDSESKPATSTSEHPSPVSVLDATYYRDDPPSPIKKKSISFKEDDPLKRLNVEQNSSDIRHCQKNTKAGLDMQIDYVESNQKFISTVMLPIFLRKNPPEKSVGEFISEYGTDSGHLINSDFLLELEKQATKGYLCIKDSYLTVEETNNIKQLHRKLIFDVLVERGVLESTSLQFLSPIKGAVRKPKVQQLLASVCSEIDQLQISENRSSSPDDDDDENFKRLLSRELELHSEKWRGGGSEASEIVLAIERMIFKDLMTEFVNGDN